MHVCTWRSVRYLQMTKYSKPLCNLIAVYPVLYSGKFSNLASFLSSSASYLETCYFTMRYSSRLFYRLNIKCLFHHMQTLDIVLYLCMYVCTYACMYVCMYIYVDVHLYINKGVYACCGGGLCGYNLRLMG